VAEIAKADPAEHLRSAATVTAKHLSMPAPGTPASP